MATGRTSKDGAWSGPCSLIVVTPTQGQAKSCFCEPAGAEPVVPATTRTPSTDAQYGARPRRWQPSLVTTPPGRYSSRASASGCGEIGIHAGFRCLWALRPWRFESSQPHFLPEATPARVPLLLLALDNTVADRAAAFALWLDHTFGDDEPARRRAHELDAD